MGSEVRRSPRFPFYASAEITEFPTQTRLTTRTSELSRHGCYIDVMNPLPLGTAVKIQIIHHEQTFDANGRVIYSQPNMGMGVAFDEIEVGQVPALEKWLSDLRGSS
jgi:PilZ domain-containing protein